MNTNELLLRAARAGIRFWLDGGRLAYRAPAGGMTGDLREEVTRHKAELIAMLEREHLDASPQVLRGRPDEHGAPLASGQERLWLIERRAGPSPLYNVHYRLRWKGALDREKLALSVRDVVARHAALRTTFAELDGVPRAIVSPDSTVELAFIDRREGGARSGTAAANDLILADQRALFDLERGPLLRGTAITLADDDHLLLITQHHIITDGWSTRIFLTELGWGYRERCFGRHASRRELALTFCDYARWQRERRAEPPYRELLAWWKEHLAGLPPLALPRDRRMRPGSPDYSGAAHDFVVPADLAAQLSDLAGEQRCTLYTVLLTAWAILLHRYCGQADFAIGTVTSGRDRAELRELIGFFANTLVLRCDLSGDPSSVEAIARLRAETESAFEREVQFADVVMATGAAGDASLTPLVETAFVLENIPIPDVLNPPGVPPIEASVTLDAQLDGSVEETAKFDLALFMKEWQDGIRGCLRYATAQFDASIIECIAESFLFLLRSIVQNPREPIGALDLISAAEQQRLLAQWDEPALPG